jgi:hypothetical protein
MLNGVCAIERAAAKHLTREPIDHYGVREILFGNRTTRAGHNSCTST